MGSNIVRLGAQPTEIKLRFEPSAGEKVPSQFREYDYLHHVNDGQLVYLDPIAHDNLLKLGAAAGDLVRLTKMRRGKETYIDVALASDAAEPTPAPIPPQSATVRTSAPVAPYVAPVPATILNGKLHERPAPAPAPVAALAPVEEEFSTLHRPAAKELALALCAAIDAAQYAQEYAKRKGFTMTPFSTEDIAKFGVHLNIGAEKRGNR